jgi:quinol monooxygenase YgiN
MSRFAVIYEFVVKPEQDNQFLLAWEELTRLIYMHEGSLGSRLHKTKDNRYMAYAQWPEKKIWEGAGDKLPEKAQDWRSKLREACEEVNTLFELDTVKDLLREKPFTP